MKRTCRPATCVLWNLKDIQFALQYFNAGTARRGREYFQAGRVISFERLDSGSYRFLVQGSRLGSYTVTLKFDGHRRIERGVAPVAACCLAGQNACPPEDLGGVFGYLRLLESLADPADPNHDESKEWLREDLDPAYLNRDNESHLRENRRFDEEEVRLINLDILQRLRGIRQLALASLVYPGALHTRFDHTLGVAHVAGQMADELGLDDSERRLAPINHKVFCVTDE